MKLKLSTSSCRGRGLQYITLSVDPLIARNRVVNDVEDNNQDECKVSCCKRAEDYAGTELCFRLRDKLDPA